MEIGTAQSIARQMMKDHGLEDWTLVLDNAKSRMGLCVYSRRQISLSRYYVGAADETHLRETMLHEIAHALIPPFVNGKKVGHGPIWKRKYAEIGGTGTRTSTNPYREEKSAAGQIPWVGTCPLGHKSQRSQRPVRVQSCGKCSKLYGGGFDKNRVLTWEYFGTPKQPEQIHPKFAREWSSLFNTPTTAVASAPRAVASPSPQYIVRLLEGDTFIMTEGQFAGQTAVVNKVGRTRYHALVNGQIWTIPMKWCQRVG